jgi:hypothetical protein
MTISEPPVEHPPGDDTALLIAALNHAWAWYDVQISRGLEVINYFLVASAVLATAYVSAINGKHYPLAAVVALAGIGLTAVTSLIVLRQSLLANDAGPVLGELQGRVAERLKIELAGTIGTQGWRARLAWSAFPATIALGLALLLSIGALLYAVIR